MRGRKFCAPAAPESKTERRKRKRRPAFPLRGEGVDGETILSVMSVLRFHASQKGLWESECQDGGKMLFVIFHANTSGHIVPFTQYFGLSSQLCPDKLAGQFVHK
jgi:hypothetical protein